jgi:hypothetical protein
MPVYYLGVPDTTALSREFELGRPRPSRERSFEGAQRFAEGAGRHGAAS